MQEIKSFLCDSLWLLWMVFFRPKSLRREAAQFNHQQRWRLIAQALAVTTVISFLLTIFTGLLLDAVFIPFGFTMSLIGVARGVLVGVLYGVLYGVLGSMARSKLFSVLYGALGGALFSVLFSMLFGAPGGVASGAAFLVSYFRLFLLPVEVPTTLWALIRARRQPMRAAQSLRHSLAYWDEVMVFPQPFLTPLLVLVGKQDRDALQRAVAHLTTNTFQLRAAVSALLELACFDSLP